MQERRKKIICQSCGVPIDVASGIKHYKMDNFELCRHCTSDGTSLYTVKTMKQRFEM